ncbi:MAG TPA: hypothetical protein VET87_21010 [Rubrivivax sp.]|nr:hypothetical protein [Rubrivivax sp.]
MSAQAGTDVGVSISVNQPGVYGRIDIGSVGVQPVLVYPHPVVIYPRPVVVAAPVVQVVQQPVYLRVPPGHAKNWRKHCYRYDACAQPVYFVQEDWYQTNYAGGPGKGKGKGKRDD